MPLGVHATPPEILEDARSFRPNLTTRETGSTRAILEGWVVKSAGIRVQSATVIVSTQQISHQQNLSEFPQNRLKRSNARRRVAGRSRGTAVRSLPLSRVARMATTATSNADGAVVGGPTGKALDGPDPGRMQSIGGRRTPLTRTLYIRQMQLCYPARGQLE